MHNIYLCKERSPVINDRAFLYRRLSNRKDFADDVIKKRKEVIMMFLIVVLALHFVLNKLTETKTKY